jgi:hypothetical protein
MAKLPTIVDSEDKESNPKEAKSIPYSVDWSPVWAKFDEFEKYHNEYLNEVTEVAEAEEQGVSTVNHWFQTPAGRNDVSENNPFSQNYAPENNQSEVPEPTTALALYEPTTEVPENTTHETPTVEVPEPTALALFETTLPNRPIVNENGEDPLYHLNKETAIALRPTIISEAQVSEDSTITFVPDSNPYYFNTGMAASGTSITPPTIGTSKWEPTTINAPAREEEMMWMHPQHVKTASLMEENPEWYKRNPDGTQGWNASVDLYSKPLDLTGENAGVLLSWDYDLPSSGAKNRTR